MRKQGLLAAASVAVLAVVACSIFLIKHTQTLTVSDDALVQRAIEHRYSGVYANLASLRKAYPSFAPVVGRWPDQTWSPFPYFSVLLPDEIAIFDRHGKYQSYRACGSAQANCHKVPPADGELGLVGIALDSRGERVANVDIALSGGLKAETAKGEQCFWVLTRPSDGDSVSIYASRENRVEISNAFGHLAIEIVTDKGPDGMLVTTYRTLRLSKQRFESLRNCTATSLSKLFANN